MVGKLWISAFSWYFQKKKNIEPTGPQNFGDAPGQIPKLILTLCPKGFQKEAVKQKVRECEKGRQEGAEEGGVV